MKSENLTKTVSKGLLSNQSEMIFGTNNWISTLPNARDALIEGTDIATGKPIIEK